MTATTMKITTHTRDRVMRIAAEDYGGATADETLQRLVDEHWERRALAAVDAYQRDDPDGYADYIRELTDNDLGGSPDLDPWEDGKAA